ncbi:MAG: Gfo/Idh/MocA family oxidoreductase [Caldilineaceae bacterium]|nr:Gfo/Idh/MocA family oxidoreductase [Caldilineaceae bacterium]
MQSPLLSPAEFAADAILEERTPVHEMIRLGIVGCGYVTALSHLPASLLTPQVAVTALADLDLSRAQEVAQHYHIPVATADYGELLGQVDGVIVAVPHNHHAAVALDFLQQGIPVLVEKPMAMSTAECQQMIDVAAAKQVALAVGQVRRFYDSSQLVKRLLETRFLGDVERFEAQEAVLFDNFNASPFTLQPPAGGVLFDTGPHVLDALHWWLGDFAQVAYWDDAIAGVEANCRLEVTTTNGVPGVIELSRTRRLANESRIWCEQGVITISAANAYGVTIESAHFAGPISAAHVVDADQARQITPFFARQLQNFAAAIQGQAPLLAPGAEGMRAIATMQRCKAAKQPMATPKWAEIPEQVIACLP